MRRLAAQERSRGPREAIAGGSAPALFFDCQVVAPPLRCLTMGGMSADIIRNPGGLQRRPATGRALHCRGASGIANAASRSPTSAK